MDKKPLLKVEDLHVNFDIPVKNGFFSKNKVLHAVNGVNFDLYEGEVLGIVGESGCGKSTLAKAILKLVDIRSGKIIWEDKDITKFSYKEMQAVRKDISVIFQDPLASLNPRMSVFEIIAEPLKIHKNHLNNEEIKKEVIEIAKKVGLLEDSLVKYPHEFSGGQCQRIGIARAVILKPKLLICDEAVSALDVSIKSQIINLLQDLKDEFNMSLLFISHDLSVVKYISDRVLVIYLGKIMESSSSEDIYKKPLHPYTKGLINSVPIPDPKLEAAKEPFTFFGEIASPFNLCKGCVFYSRCPMRFDKCGNSAPEFYGEDDHKVACFLYGK